ncbi:MAG: glycoside hydrolase family 3 C-terminal domain-containing protein [Paludibacteraceae bacterium]|nr:glycoside hydrolase family 3 C-terminal domain-containing protein [Paludibacteraceae bacterium]
MNKRLFLTLAASLVISSGCIMADNKAAVANPSSVQLRADNIDEVVRTMTLEEKARLLVGVADEDYEPGTAGRQTQFVYGAAGITYALPQYGIPSTLSCDGPAGVHIDSVRPDDNRRFFATGFPIASCLAATWNTELVENVGKAMGNETLEYGCDLILGPGLNIHRNPLCGRNFEYYSEDPYVTGVIGAAMVNGIQSQGVGACPKHYAVNSQETERFSVDEQVSERALREIYLRGFERMVREAHPWSIMSAYNRVNGVYAQCNKLLLTDILRDDWGFNGIVITDWIGKRADLPVEDAIKAGNEVMMPGYPVQIEDIMAAVKDGRLPMEDLDRSVRRTLEFIVKTPRFKNYHYSEAPDRAAHSAITRQAGTEGMVLLKNNGVLPMQTTGRDTIALFGVNSYDFLSGGVGSGCVNVEKVVDMVAGLKAQGISTTPTLTDIYQKYVQYARVKLMVDKNPLMWFLDQGQPKLDEIEITERCMRHEAEHASAAIITIARQAGEGIDRQIDGEFTLTDLEQTMIQRVSDIFHEANKPVIVVINSGSVIETVSWRDKVDAILMAWQPGQEGGNAVADVLTGKVSPSGRLTMTWPVSVYDHWSTRNFPQDYDMYSYQRLQQRHRPIKGITYTKHEEGIYVGYRYFDTYNKQVAYPFGYGLSYTTFEYAQPKVKMQNDVLTVTVTVTNTGKTAGKEVVQVYVHAPEGGMDKPEKELRAFAKTRLLNAGEKETLTMEIKKADLASWDETVHAWKVDAGEYTVMVAANVNDVRGSATVKIK